MCNDMLNFFPLTPGSRRECLVKGRSFGDWIKELLFEAGNGSNVTWYAVG